MMANLIGGFVAIIVGVSLIAPVSTETYNNSQTVAANGSCPSAHGTLTDATCDLSRTSGWSVTVLRLVPGFFSLGVLGIGIAVTYSALRQAGVV